MINHKNLKSGFTLVELSIVLVIIGLLIGGILVAQSIIDSTKISATIQQLSQFDASVAAFESKFNQIPGDSKHHGGDGDGKVEAGNVFTTFDNTSNAHLNEVSNFWCQAYSDEYKCTGYNVGSGANASRDEMITSGESKNTPEAKIRGKNFAFIVQRPGNGTDNYYTITTTESATAAGIVRYVQTADGNKALAPIQLFSIDTKIDDAAANSGIVISGRFIGGSVAGVSPSAVGYSECSSGTDYLIDDPDYQCTPFFRMGSFTGDLK